MIQRLEKSRRGFNLIEAAIVLGVVGLVIGGIWVAAAAVNENMKVTETTNGIVTTVKNIQGLISTQDAASLGSLYDLTDTILKADGFPKNWVSGTTVTNPFGGQIVIYNFTPNERFDLYLVNIPVSACIKLVSKISAMGASAGSSGSGLYNRSSLGYIQLATISSGWNVIWATATFPVTPTDVSTPCNSGVEVIALTFGYTRIN